MPRVKIKQLDSRVATSGLFMGRAKPPKFRRKLEPGEVIELAEEDPLLADMWDTGLIEITLERPTRPLDFDNYNEARYTSPTFKSRGPDEDKLAEQVRERIATELRGDDVDPDDAAPQDRETLSDAIEKASREIGARKRGRRGSPASEAHPT